MYNILMVDDEKSYFELLTESNNPNFKFYYLDNPQDISLFLNVHKIDLILMDWNLGKNDGLEIVKDMREQIAVSGIPIIMVSGNCETEKMIKALYEGVDSYVTKPYSVEFLMAKIVANLRKYRVNNEYKKLFIKNFLFDENALSVDFKGNKFVLTKKEFSILKLLVENPERTFTRDELNQIDCPAYPVSSRTVDTFIRHLRKKFDRNLIVTISKKGYKINGEVLG